MNLSELQAAVGKWAEATFPHATDATMIAHLQEEMGELTRAVHGDESTVSEEAADVLLILLHLCHRHGIDLSAAAARKFAECRNRRWEQDAARGYVRHVAEPHPRSIIEAGAGFAPGELAQGAAEDGAERVMQAAESWWGQQ